ncbi:MAG: RNA-binding domain-containing protein, partial [Dehalococcoidia bacterium]
MTPEELKALVKRGEGRGLEFKAARNRFDFDELVRYVVAIANEGGGHILLGVENDGTVAGTKAFPDSGRTEAGIFERLGRRARLDVVQADGQRVLVVAVPSRLPGEAWS